MRSAIKKHMRGICCALFVGLITVLPQFLIPASLGIEYKGIQPLLLDDEDIYRTRIHEVLEGHLVVASPFFHEYKDAPVAVPPVNEWLYAIPSFVFGLSALIVVSKFLLPALLFLLVYLLVRRLVVEEDELQDGELAALAAAFLVTLGYDFVDVQQVINIILGHAEPGKIIWTRIVNPIIGAVEVFGFLLLLPTAAMRNYRAAAIGAGVLLGAMVGYFFSFGISVCILGIGICVTILMRRWQQLKQLLLVLAVSTLVDAPYWYATFSTIGGSGGRELAMRNGMTYTHAPIVNKFLVASSLLVLISFCYAYFKGNARTQKGTWSLLAILLLGCMLAFNQQVITGREIWYHHFVQYAIPIAFVSIIVALYLSLRPVFPRRWRLLMWGFIIASVSMGVASSLNSTLHADSVRDQQSYAPVFGFLEQHAQKDCVVLVVSKREELERAIPAYTNCDDYVSESIFYGITRERVLHNYYLMLRMGGVPAADFRQYIIQHPEGVHTYFFDNWTNMFASGADTWVMSLLPSLESGYREFMSVDLKTQIFKYRMDFIVSEGPLPETLLGELPGLKLTHSTGRFSIYQF